MPRKKFGPLYYIGWVVLIFGSAFTGASISNQLKTTDGDGNYYREIAAGVAIMAVGFTVGSRASNRARPLSDL